MKQRKRSKLPQSEAPIKAQPKRSLKVPSQPILMLLLLLLGVMTYQGLQMSHLAFINDNKEAFFYDQHTPIMTTEDAYYYLRLTSDLVKGHYNTVDELRPGFERPHPVPLIISISAIIHKISGAAIELIAFYLPPMLASLMVIVYLLWGYELGGPFVVLVASLAGISSSYWCNRTSLGYFDTDCMNPVFLYLIIFCVYRFASIQSRQRFVYLLAALFLNFLFRLWWIPGGHLGLLVIVLTYSTSFFVVSSKSERLLKMFLLTFFSLTCIAVILASSGVFTGFFGRLLGPEIAFLQFFGEPNSLFPNVGQSISELRALTWRDFAVKAGGNEVTFVLSIVGLFFLFHNRREVATFFLPGLLFGLGGVFSQRLIIFFVPAYAIGIGYLLGQVVLKGKYLQAIHRPFLRFGVWSAILILLLFPGFRVSFSEHPKPSQTADDVRLARVLADATGPQGSVWAWWDAGYFLQFITGKKTFIDGGSQSPEKTYAAAYPLAATNPILAKNWIRFFAGHDSADLDTLVSRLGDIPRAMSFLQEALGNPLDLEIVLGKHQLNDSLFWRQYLFPEVEAYLFLDYATLAKGSWWYYFGSWDFGEQRGSKPDLFRVIYSNLLASEQDGVLIDNDYIFKLDRVISVGSSGTDVDKVNYRDFRGRDRNNNMLAGLAKNKKIVYKQDSVVVLDKKRGSAYLLDGKLFQSLVCQLLFQRPYDSGQFTPLAYFASGGGVWRVE